VFRPGLGDAGTAGTDQPRVRQSLFDRPNRVIGSVVRATAGSTRSVEAQRGCEKRLLTSLPADAVFTVSDFFRV
jgi:hypothetical protein